MQKDHKQSRLLLRRTDARGPACTQADDVRHDPRAEALGRNDRILCRECGHPITSPRDRVTIQGSHAHTFANPAGILYEIGCFRTAAGCAHVGPATPEWSWFAGYCWRVALCAACFTHLGWLYQGRGRDAFHGLILNRLAQAS